MSFRVNGRATLEDVQAEHLDPTESRRARMKRWIDEHVELDLPSTKGVVTFHLGRDQAGRSQVSGLFSRDQKPERL